MADASAAHDSSPPARRRAAAFSDLDLDAWRELDDIIVDSLWLLGARDRTGPHTAEYWGNFVPQIPRQILRRFTRRGEVVVDLFGGLGTTLIECRHLGRHGLALELNPAVAARAEEQVSRAENPHGVTTRLLVGDAADPAAVAVMRGALAELGQTQADCLILHPPYHNIIRFSDDPRDLSACADLDAFLTAFAAVVRNAWELLRPGRFAALVIGDAYADGEWIPLGFECMQVCRRAGFSLRAINVKDIQGNERGKGPNSPLWRYRALRSGFYLFKHEYVMLFRRPADGVRRS